MYQRNSTPSRTLRFGRSYSSPTPVSFTVFWEAPYILWLMALVTTEQQASMYETIDDDLIATASHATDWYKIDNDVLYDLLKPLIIGGEGWPHIMQYNAARDGHTAWNALEKQGERAAAITIQKAEAYTSIDNLCVFWSLCPLCF
jgi:hypothetical protein